MFLHTLTMFLHTLHAKTFGGRAPIISQRQLALVEARGRSGCLENNKIPAHQLSLEVQALMRCPVV